MSSTARSSIYPKKIQKMILSSYDRGESAPETAQRINESKTARNLKRKFTATQMITTFGNITRGHGEWA